MNLTKQHILLSVILVVLALFLSACAKQGMPSGGPKDVTPPQLHNAQPDNGTLNFNSNGFYIEFDEYVVLKDADNNILVSPPLKNKPEYRTKGRGIQVRLHDTLQPNTTYLFQFKNAVADFNEGNLLPSFEYVFSTGATIDSMTLRGRVLDAQSLEARKETVTVLLTDASDKNQLTILAPDDSGTAPSPSYVTRCDSNGNFAFNYIASGVYYVTALVDENKNLKVDASEPVAFTRDHFVAHPDNDSLASIHPVVLRLFDPANEKQRITGSNFLRQGLVAITTSGPLQSPSIVCDETHTWRLNSTRDTLTLWTLHEKCDSLRLVISDPSGLQDTLKLRWRSKRGKTGTSTANESTDKNVMTLVQKTLPYYDTLTLAFVTPLDPTRCHCDSVATVMLLSDSSVVYCCAELDTGLLKARLLFPFKQGEKYGIHIPAKMFYDIYSHPNDSLKATFTVTKAEEYGNLSLEVVPDTTSGQLIVELLNEKKTVVAQRITGGNEKVRFPHLAPGKYRVRVILDTNRNGRWDTGDYTQMHQPERVVYLKKTLDIRANWDFEEKLTIGE